MNARRAGLALGVLLAGPPIMGHTAPAEAGAPSFEDLAFTPLDACRLFDVRLRRERPRGDSSAQVLVLARAADLSEQGGSASGCGVPEDALAVLVHVRAIKGSVSGALRLWGAERPRPAEPLLRYEVGDSEMSTVVPLCASGAQCPQGEIAVEASATPVHVTIDVAGYFRRDRALAGFSCAEGECVTGFDADGQPTCAPCGGAACPSSCSGHGTCLAGHCACEAGWIGPDCATPAPTDCVLSEWGDWSPCSTTCGAGTQTRSRTVVQPPANGGLACGALVETRACSSPPCPVDCVMSEWGPWGACSASCGGGVQSRSRLILQPPANGGKACGPISETQACALQPCPTDCVMGEWGPWSPCSVSCGTGVQTRTRPILQPPTGGGLACGPTMEQQACVQPACP
jgi:hypothetical protein